MLVPVRHKKDIERLTTEAIKRGDKKGNLSPHHQRYGSIRLTRSPLKSAQDARLPDGTNLQRLQTQIQDQAMLTIIERRKGQREQDYAHLMQHVLETYTGCETQEPRNNRSLLEPDEKKLLKLLRKETTTIGTVEEMRTHMTMKIMWLIQEYNMSMERADLAEERYKLLFQTIATMDAQRGSLERRLGELSTQHEEAAALHKDIEFALRDKIQTVTAECERLKVRFKTVRALLQKLEKEKKAWEFAQSGQGDYPGSPLTLVAKERSEFGHGSALSPGFDMADESLRDELEDLLADNRSVQSLFSEDVDFSTMQQPLYLKCKELAEKLHERNELLRRAAQNDKIYQSRAMEAEEEMYRARDAYERLQRIHDEDVKQHQSLLVHLRDKHIEQVRDIETANANLATESETLRSDLAGIKHRHKLMITRMKELKEITMMSDSIPVLLNRLQTGEKTQKIAQELRTTWEALVAFNKAESSGINPNRAKATINSSSQTDRMQSGRLLDGVVLSTASAPLPTPNRIIQDLTKKFPLKTLKIKPLRVLTPELTENNDLDNANKKEKPNALDVGERNHESPELTENNDLDNAKKKERPKALDVGERNHERTKRRQSTAPIQKEVKFVNPPELIVKKSPRAERGPVSPRSSSVFVSLHSSPVVDAPRKSPRSFSVVEFKKSSRKSISAPVDLNSPPTSPKNPTKNPTTHKVSTRDKGAQTVFEEEKGIIDLPFMRKSDQSLDLIKMNALLEAERKTSAEAQHNVAELRQELAKIKKLSEARGNQLKGAETLLKERNETVTKLSAKIENMLREIAAGHGTSTLTNELHSADLQSKEQELQSVKGQLARLQAGEIVQDMVRKEVRIGTALERLLRAEESMTVSLNCLTCMTTLMYPVMLIPCGHIMCLKCFQQSNPDEEVGDYTSITLRPKAWQKKTVSNKKGTLSENLLLKCSECRKICVESFHRVPLLDDIISKQFFKREIALQLKGEIHYQVVDTSVDAKAPDHGVALDMMEDMMDSPRVVPLDED